MCSQDKNVILEEFEVPFTGIEKSLSLHEKKHSKPSFFYSPMQGISDSNSRNFSGIFGTGLIYKVPKFQRDYSWNKDQWDDLWQDIQDIQKGDEADLYMGYLVLQTKDALSHVVIDGQQRLTTMSIIILACLNRLKELIENNVESVINDERSKQIRNAYIGEKDLQTRYIKNKLVLNRNNDHYYSTYLVPLQQSKRSGLKPSEKRLKECFDWFSEKIAYMNSGSQIAEFVTLITTKLFFTIISVSEEVNAYKIFETLNARGVELSAADLLKNFLFQKIAEEGNKEAELDKIDTWWASIVSKLGNKEIPEYLRVYWNSRHKTVRKANLYKTIRKEIKTKAKAFELIAELDNHANAYVALLNPQDEFWQNEKEISESLTALKIFGKKQSIALLLTAYEKLYLKRKRQFKDLVKACVVVSFRRNVISSLNPNDEEAVYNDMAIKLHSKDKIDLSDFDKIYLGDDSFKEAFLKKDDVGAKVAKYILGNIYGDTVDYESHKITIEHILPQSKSPHWNIKEDIAKEYRDRLGNLTLLEHALQKKTDNFAPSVKLKVFQSSKFQGTKLISQNHTDWTPTDIDNRQMEMADMAIKVWAIKKTNKKKKNSPQL